MWGWWTLYFPLKRVGCGATLAERPLQICAQRWWSPFIPPQAAPPIFREPILKLFHRASRYSSILLRNWKPELKELLAYLKRITNNSYYMLGRLGEYCRKPRFPSHSDWNSRCALTLAQLVVLAKGNLPLVHFSILSVCVHTRRIRPMMSSGRVYARVRCSLTLI